MAFVLVAWPLLGGELHDACRRGDLDAVKKLVAANPGSVNQLDNSKLTPLMLAARTNAAVVAFLLQNKADHRIRGFMGTTALHSAAIKHQKEAILVLVKHGADVNEQDEAGWTAALYAAGKFGPRRKDALAALVASKADLSISNKEGTSVFTYARNDPELAAILRQLGARF